jgi:hypothetical protein
MKRFVYHHALTSMTAILAVVIFASSTSAQVGASASAYSYRNLAVDPRSLPTHPLPATGRDREIDETYGPIVGTLRRHHPGISRKDPDDPMSCALVFEELEFADRVAIANAIRQRLSVDGIFAAIDTNVGNDGVRITLNGGGIVDKISLTPFGRARERDAASWVATELQDIALGRNNLNDDARPAKGANPRSPELLDIP